MPRPGAVPGQSTWKVQHTMPDKHIRLLVSGGSIAGLSTAYWLARYGFKVTVVERAPHLRPGGQALDVRGPALEVVGDAGYSISLTTGQGTTVAMVCAYVLAGELVQPILLKNYPEFVQ